MIEQAAPVAPFVYEGKPSPRRTFADAIRLVITYPRAVLGPLYLVQTPASLATAVGMVLLYATIFEEKDVVHPADLYLEGDRAQQFWFTLFVGIEALFSVVARGAAIVAIASVARGRPLPLKQVLDPAFTRMGGLLLIVVLLGVGAGGLFLIIIGIPVAVYLFIRFAVVFDAYMLENESPMGALGRAWNLSRGNVIGLIATIALGLLAVIPVVIFASVLTAATASDRMLQVLLIAGSGVVQTLLIVPAIGVLTALTTLFYLNLKANEHGRYAP